MKKKTWELDSLRFLKEIFFGNFLKKYQLKKFQSDRAQ